MTARDSVDDLNALYAGKLASVAYQCTCSSCPTLVPQDGTIGLIQEFTHSSYSGALRVIIIGDHGSEVPFDIEDENTSVWIYPDNLLTFDFEDDDDPIF